MHLYINSRSTKDHLKELSYIKYHSDVDGINLYTLPSSYSSIAERCNYCQGCKHRRYDTTWHGSTNRIILCNDWRVL